MPVPQFCAEYNSQCCRNGNKCKALHVCKSFILGRCVGKKCALSHDIFSNQPFSVLLKAKVDVGRSTEEILAELKKGLRLEEEDDTSSDDESDDDCYQEQDGKEIGEEGKERQLVTCVFYNKEQGCKHGLKCRNLHMCYHYLKNDCKYPNKCRRSHNILDPQPRKILQQFGISIGQAPESILDELCSKLKFKATEKIVRNERGAVGGRARSPRTRTYSSGTGASGTGACGIGASGTGGARKPRHSSTSNSRNQRECQTPKLQEVCVYHLLKNCSFGETCNNYHTSHELPYVWRWRPKEGGAEREWEEFARPIQQELETCYCDPCLDECYAASNSNTIKYKVDLVKMQCSMKQGSRERELEVARLSTKSTIGSITGFLFLTDWLWYWSDYSGHWLEFGLNEDGQKILGCITSKDIEKEFESNPQRPIAYHVGGAQYELSFTSMTQTNKGSGFKRPIKRRPAMFDPETKQARPRSTVVDGAQFSKLTLT